MRKNAVFTALRLIKFKLFLFLGEEGVSTYEASPLPLPSPLQPHCTLEVAT